jgi:glycosyltransferase involved in cell wall biosynthesis
VILFVSGEYPPDVGGVGDYTDRLRGALAERGWPSSVVSRRQVRRWDARSLVWLLRSTPSSASGVVHIQFQAGAYDLLGDVCLLPAVLHRLRPRLDVVTTFHDTRVPYLFPGARALRRRAVRLMADTSRLVIAADKRDLVALGGPSPRHFQIPIGPNVTRSPPAGFERRDFRAQLGLQPETVAVAYFGLLNASKGLDALLDAFELVSQAEPRARLLLLGGGTGASDATDVTTAASLKPRLDKLGARLLRPGWLPPAALSAYLLAADVALLPYVDGASPRRGSLLACAAHGLPIVSTEPASPEVRGAVQAVPLTPADLAHAVLDIVHDSALVDSLRAASRSLACSMSWSRIARDHIALYEQLQ